MVKHPDKVREIERSLTIEKIIDNAMPICVLAKNSSLVEVHQALDIQLTKLVASLNLKWNLTDNQIKTIVEDLIDKYKNESLEDFILVFKKARQGEFGELYRLDSAVIFGWMEAYLSEKYEILERKMMAEKENIYKSEIPNSEKHRYWLDKLLDVIGATEIVKPVRGLTTEEINTEGQERPPQGYTISRYEMETQRDEHRAKVRRCREMTVRERHPDWDEDKILKRLDELDNEF